MGNEAITDRVIHRLGGLRHALDAAGRELDYGVAVVCKFLECLFPAPWIGGEFDDGVAVEGVVDCFFDFMDWRAPALSMLVVWLFPALDQFEVAGLVDGDGHQCGRIRHPRTIEAKDNALTQFKATIRSQCLELAGW